MTTNVAHDWSTRFGDYIIYVDESGDHSPAYVQPTYPVFVLAFCVFEKIAYATTICPEVQRLKFAYFGHDLVVLHERDVVRQTGPFLFLNNAARRTAFIRDLTRLMIAASFSVIAVAIRKPVLVDRSRQRAETSNPSAPPHLYHFALQLGLWRVAAFLETKAQAGSLTHVVFERRGPAEDRMLEAEFLRVTLPVVPPWDRLPLDIVLCPKAANTCGLQIADLVARPIGRHVLDPTQPNRAFDVVAGKLWRELTIIDRIESVAKAEGPRFSPEPSAGRDTPTHFREDESTAC
jgi:hypothetical protein